MATPSSPMPSRTFFNCKSAWGNAQNFMEQVRRVLQRVVKSLALRLESELGREPTKFT
jgi:hypothetical protein